MSVRQLTGERIDRSLAGVRDRSRVSIAVVAALVATPILFVAYDRLSATAAITADSANAVLQGRSMAAGNLLLRGWTLSGASFLVSDLPLYALFAAVRGVSPAVAHDVGAALYALLVLSCCLLARGTATGAAGAWRMAITTALLIAPAPGVAVELLLLGPFHVGTTVLLILALVALDRAAAAPWALAVTGLLLSLAIFSDALSLYVGILPIAVVASLRLVRREGATGHNRALLLTLAAAVLASSVATWALEHSDAFATVPLQGSFADIDDMPKNVALTIQGALVMFGANFFGQPQSAQSLPILLRLAMLGFVIASWRLALRDWREGTRSDLVTQVLAVGMGVDLAAYLFSNQAIDLMTSRYLVPFLAYGSVLAGRVGARWLEAGWRRSVAVAAVVASTALLVLNLVITPAAGSDAELIAFLHQHNLRYGLAGYWQASTVTVESGGQVRVRAVDWSTGPPSPYRWEAESGWYDTTRPGNDATFVLRDTADSRSADPQAIRSAFGPPASDYRVGRWEVMVWDRNLLNDLSRG